MNVDLTIQEYLKYKKRKLKDKEIARLVGTNILYLIQWKEQNGIKGLRISHLYRLEAERLKKEYIKLHNKGWKDESIREHLKLTMTEFYNFKTEYLPEYKRTSPIAYTEEEKRIMKQNGVDCRLAYYRMQKGMSKEEAISTPKTVRHFTKRQKKIVEEKGINSATVWDRIDKGMSFKEAVNTPVQVQKEYSIKYKLLAEKHGIEWSLALNRVHRGWDIETACTKPKRRFNHA